MAYLTQAQLEERVESDELLDVAADGNDQLDAQRIQRALDDATDEINSYIGQAYALPLPTVPRVLGPVVVDLAMYHLARGMASREELERRYKAKINWLKLVADRKVSLGLPELQEPDSSESSFHGDGRDDFSSWSP